MFKYAIETQTNQDTASFPGLSSFRRGTCQRRRVLFRPPERDGFTEGIQADEMMLIVRCRRVRASPLALAFGYPLAFATAPAAPLLVVEISTGKKTFSSASAPSCKPPCEVSNHSAPRPRRPRRSGGLLLSTPSRPRPVDLRGGRRARWRSRSGSSARCWRFVPFFSSKRASPSLAGPVPCPRPPRTISNSGGGDERRLGQRIGAPYFRCS